MSGILNILLASGASGPPVHPPYSLDGLGVDDPPVITAGFSGTDLTFSFDYTVPDDGNEFRQCLIVMVGDVLSNRTMTVNYGSQGAYPVSFQPVQDSGPDFKTWHLLFETEYGGGPLNDSFIITRGAGGSATDLNFNIRVYTFGDCAVISGTAYIQFPPLNIAPPPVSGDEFTLSPAPERSSALIQLAARTDYASASGRDTVIVDPIGPYTYSPEGDQGVGLLTNGAEACVVEMAFDVTPAEVVFTRWDFLGGQPGETAAVNVVELIGAQY